MRDVNSLRRLISFNPASQLSQGGRLPEKDANPRGKLERWSAAAGEEEAGWSNACGQAPWQVWESSQFHKS